MFGLRRGLSALFLAMALLPAVAQAADVYVVTATENKQNLDLEEVKHIFLGDVTKWVSGKNIILAVPDLSSPEGEVMLEKLFGMSAKEYKKYWMQKVFKGEATNPPENKNGDSMKQFLKAYPDAIGILTGSQADGMRKVVKVE